MDRNTESETESEVLIRIVAMLFSFAALAQLASVRSYPVRCLVLWALRRAEAVVRDWLAADRAQDLQAIVPIAVMHRNSRAEALHLAESFRALARMLKREVRLEEQLARRLLRGNADRSTNDAPRRDLFKLEPLRRLAWTMRFVMRYLHGLETAPRLDTS